MSERIFTVNEVIDDLSRLCDSQVLVRCVIHLEHENNCILHIPKAERRDDLEPGGPPMPTLIGSRYYGSSLWLETNARYLPPTALTGDHLAAFVGRQVLVTAVVNCAAHGHFDLWAAGVMLTQVSRVRKRDLPTG
jgi:hypothetical protein